MLLFEPIAELLAPSRCVSCRRRSPPPWCRECDRRVARPIPGAGCDRCGLPGADATDAHPCWQPGSVVDRSVVVHDYRGPVADAIVAGKTRGLTAVWAPLGRELGARLVATGVTGDVVVPVPTDPVRRRERGVDHTRLLAREVGAGLGCPVRSLVRIRRGAVDRGRAPVGERGGIPDGLFRPTRRLSGARVVVVDDVLTTGATADAVAGTLRRAGAAAVVLGVVARAGRHQLATRRAGDTART